MRESVTAAQLCLDGRGGFTYVVALMRYIVREDETFRYELEPNYEVIDLLDSSDFQGIPGFDLSVRKTCYERDNRTPTLIADRAPMANREDLWSLLDECGMDYWDPLEWLPPALYRRQAVLPRSARRCPWCPGDGGGCCVCGELAPGRWLGTCCPVRRRCRGMRGRALGRRRAEGSLRELHAAAREGVTGEAGRDGGRRACGADGSPSTS